MATAAITSAFLLFTKGSRQRLIFDHLLQQMERLSLFKQSEMPVPPQMQALDEEEELCRELCEIDDNKDNLSLM